jgi:MFS transporter, CP family, cyanate transporter
MVALGRRLPDAAVGPAARWWPDWRGAETWRLGLVLGGIGTVYFATNAFIPDYLHTAGRADLIGPCLAALNAGQLPASAIALVTARAITGRRAPLLVVSAGMAVSLALFLLAPPALWVAGAGLVGFCCAFGLVLALALPPLVAPARDVHHLSAGMFAVGYGYSFLLPLLGGVAWDISHVPAAAFLPAFAGAATTAAVALTLPRRAARTPDGESGLAAAP